MSIRVELVDCHNLNSCQIKLDASVFLTAVSPEDHDSLTYSAISYLCCPLFSLIRVWTSDVTDRQYRPPRIRRLTGPLSNSFDPPRRPTSNMPILSSVSTTWTLYIPQSIIQRVQEAWLAHSARMDITAVPHSGRTSSESRDLAHPLLLQPSVREYSVV